MKFYNQSNKSFETDFNYSYKVLTMIICVFSQTEIKISHTIFLSSNWTVNQSSEIKLVNYSLTNWWYHMTCWVRRELTKSHSIKKIRNQFLVSNARWTVIAKPWSLVFFLVSKLETLDTISFNQLISKYTHPSGWCSNIILIHLTSCKQNFCQWKLENVSSCEFLVLKNEMLSVPGGLLSKQVNVWVFLTLSYLEGGGGQNLPPKAIFVCYCWTPKARKLKFCKFNFICIFKKLTPNIFC